MTLTQRLTMVIQQQRIAQQRREQHHAQQRQQLIDQIDEYQRLQKTSYSER